MIQNEEVCDLQVTKSISNDVEDISIISSGFVFNFVLSVLFGVVAITVQRFKVLWVPHMCVLAAAGMTHVEVKKKIGEILGLHKNMVN